MQPILGVTKQRCHELAQRADFPEPAKAGRAASSVAKKRMSSDGETRCGFDHGHRLGVIDTPLGNA